MSRRPPNHGTYQIWHEGKTLAVEVQGTNVRDVERLTSNPPARWSNHPDVQTHVEHPRSTKLGDVIVDPTCGAWEVQEDRYLAVPPPEPVADRMRREGIVPEHLRLLKEWLGHMQEQLSGEEGAIPPPTAARPPSPSEIARRRGPDGQRKEDGQERGPANGRERDQGR